MTDRQPRSLLDWFLHRGQRQANRTALWIPAEVSYRQLTWGEWWADVLAAAAMLDDLGVNAGDRVAQVSENRYEWLVADLAIQCVGAIHVPLHAPLSGRQLAREIRHCGAKLVLISTTAQLTKLDAAWPIDGQATDNSLTSTRVADASLESPAPHVLLYDLPLDKSNPSAEHFAVSSWHAQTARAESSRGVVLAGRASENAQPHHVLKILYTSGTTGDSKGVMLTQGNLLFNAAAIATAYGERSFERKLNFLALSHVFAQTNDFYSTLVAGCELGLARTRESVLEDCRLVQPTFLNGVPSFYQRALQTLVAAGREREPGTLRELLGGRLEMCNAGGAPLPDRVFDAYVAQGIPILQGYGLTETSPVISVSTPAANRRGSVGRPLAGVEVSIAADGEVLTRGPHVMAGYFRDDEATRAALRNGWFHTGDLGDLDDGFLRITGRKKEMIALDNGRKVAPLAIEAAVLADPLFEQVLVFGDGRSRLVAIVYLQPQLLATALAATPPATVRQIVANRLREALRDRAQWEQIRDVGILPEPLRVERGELTAKHSLRRDVVRQRYEAIVEPLE